MDAYGPSSYGDAFADIYDDWYGPTSDTADAVDRVAELAGDGPVLELGVGTGRLAIPLAARGVEVWGLDASPAMLDRLRAKPGGDQVHTVEADMANFGLGEGRFSLVFVVYNTFFNLTTPDAQARCLTLAADHLAPRGRLLIEAFVPDEEQYPLTGAVEVRAIEADRVVLSVSRSSPTEAQVKDGQHIEISERGIRLRPWRIRYLRPDQLDDLAAAAGLQLEARWAGWRNETFDANSATHVTVYGRIPN